MSVVKTSASCPYCREPIHPAATKCKHCQSDLTQTQKKKGSLFAKYNTFRYGFAGGVLFSVVLIILTYFQFFRD